MSWAWLGPVQLPVMLRHRLLDLVPDALRGRAADWYWPRVEAEFDVLPRVLPAGGVAVDVGVWWGPWTSAMAKTARQVHSFEPQPRLAAAMRRRAPANVTVHEVALSDREGSAELWMPASRPGLDALASLRPDRSSIELEREGTIEVMTVQTATLDSFGLVDLDFVKIDVEGHETEVLRGAEETLARSKPALLIEVEQRHHQRPIAEVFDMLARQGYDGSFLRDGVWENLETFDVERDQQIHNGEIHHRTYINNFLFTQGDA